jgi:DNA (cytosine-5)-methyltransferase 1
MGKPKVISLYTGAGGLDYGFEAAGFSTAVAVEMNHDSCETLRANRRWPVIERDILRVSSHEILRTAGLRKGEAAVLIGGPPCQPFSKAGYWSKGDSGRLDDPRAATLGAYLRVLEDTTPAAFLLENVEGLAYRGKDEGLRLLLDAIEGVNKRTKSKYRPTMQVVMAADYGVPQLRKRFIMIAARDGTEFTFPKPTHAAPQLEQTSLFDRLPPYRTAWDALADVGPDEGEDVAVRGRWAELLPSIPEGHNYLWHTDRMGGMPLFGWRRRYWSFLLKLAQVAAVVDGPGPAGSGRGTVPLGQPAARHARARADPDLPRRRPGDREPDRDPAPDRQRGALAARGGPGPRDLGAAPWQPSPQGSAAPAAHRSLPRTRRPARRAAVPLRFHHLVGEHTAHPGTGRGHGASKRTTPLAIAS